MSVETVLPAIRSKVGDWNYYVTTLTFAEIAELVKAPDEIHERKKLADWIQREAIDTHSDEIAAYLISNPQRFLGALIIGVYGGHPSWAPITVRLPSDEELTEAQEKRVNSDVGILTFAGNEKLFAIDGQHRVSGIKQAISANEELSADSVCAIFVGHNPKTAEGKVRTRRLFTTVNKRAKAVGKAARIALDEDDGFAIVARRLIDAFWLFEDDRKHVVYSSSGSLPKGDRFAITSVVGLYELAKDLYGPPWPPGFDKSRPADSELEKYLNFFVDVLEKILSTSSELKRVFKRNAAQPGDYRQGSKNHLLFRPAGQRAFFKALQVLIARGSTVEDAIRRLLKADLYLSHSPWHHILWDPVTETMITTRVSIAETQLLRLAGEAPRTRGHAQKLDKLLDGV